MKLKLFYWCFLRKRSWKVLNLLIIFSKMHIFSFNSKYATDLLAKWFWQDFQKVYKIYFYVKIRPPDCDPTHSQWSWFNQSWINTTWGFLDLLYWYIWFYFLISCTQVSPFLTIRCLEDILKIRLIKFDSIVTPHCPEDRDI